MNTYAKYCPNVFVAKCDEKHEKGETIIVTTKHGKENECIVWNFLGERNGSFLYSITRADGFDSRERARLKAERYEEWSNAAMRRSNAACEQSDAAVAGIPFGQPILVGHHSEKAHRRALEKAHAAMDRCVAESNKAEAHAAKAEYWERMADKIDLSMPESIEYFRYLVEKRREYHEGLKSGKYPREHAYSMTYAKKHLNEAEANLKKAIMLWGDNSAAA